MIMLLKTPSYGPFFLSYSSCGNTVCLV